MTETEKKVFADAIKTYGENAQTDMAIEEMSELTKALLKYRRSQHGDKTCGNNLVGNIVEEIEDVQIMLDQLMLIYGRDEATRCMKIARLRERLKEAGNNDRDNQS